MSHLLDVMIRAMTAREAMWDENNLSEAEVIAMKCISCEVGCCGGFIQPCGNFSL